MKSSNVVLVAAISLLALATGCKGRGKAEAADQPIRTVRTQPVGLGNVVHEVELVGELQGIEEVRVFPQVADRIRKLAVREGQAVKEGDVLAIVNADLQSDAVIQAQAGLEAAIANRDAVTDNLRRTKDLAKAGSATQSQLQTLEAQARAAEAQVRQATAGLGQASTQRSRAVIRAPIAGVVSGLILREGDMASPAAPLLTLVRDHRVKAVFRVPEREFLKIREGQKVTLRPLADESISADATVSVRGSVVDRMTRTGLLEVELENADRKFMAGAAVRGIVETGRREGVVLVPAEAVLLSGDTERTGHAIVFTTDGKIATRRDVKVGARQGGQLEIVEGLKQGETLVVQGAHFLRDKSPVKIATDGKPVETASKENG